MWTYKVVPKRSTDEYVTRFYMNGVEHKPARYYATDRQDADDTGRIECARLNGIKDDERSSVAHHLRIAAERYDENIRTLVEHGPNANITQEAIERLCEQFQRQAKQARMIADRLEE